jgi:hypothetical protein
MINSSMTVKNGTILKAQCNYYNTLTSEQLITKGNTYTVRIGTDGCVYIQTDDGKSYELSVHLMDQMFTIEDDNYDYAMAII